MSEFQRILLDLDEDFLASFDEQIAEEVGYVESAFMFVHLDESPTKKLEAIYESVLRIERLCRLGFLDPLSIFMKKIELILDEMFAGNLQVCETLTEVMLLCFDIVRSACQDIVKIRSLDVQLLEECSHELEVVRTAAPGQRHELYLVLLQKFSVRVKDDLIFSPFEERTKVQEQAKHDSEELHREPGKDHQLDYFLELAEALELRFEHWRGRNTYILQTCSLLNACLDYCVDPRQLTAAVYLHDVGMAFLPDKIVYKVGYYTPEEVMLMQNHPYYAYAMLRGFEDFSEAANMVLHHHERYDGKGYPGGLQYQQVGTGAQMIALADTLYALTHNRPDRNYRKSLIRSMSEINRATGTQFSPELVAALNEVSAMLK